MSEKEFCKLKKTIVLVGLMGCGKSAIGKLLAERLDVGFFDSDSVIEQESGEVIKDIFSKYGESHFRKLEKDVIASLIKNSNCIISTGGGAFMCQDTREIIKNSAVSVWIRADIDILLERVSRKDNRPLLENGDKRQILQELIDVRYPVYETADIIVDTTTGPHEIVVNQIIEKIADIGV